MSPFLEGDAGLSTCDAIIVGIPHRSDPTYQQALLQLGSVAAAAAAVGVVACLPSLDRDLMRDAIGAGAYDYFVESASMDEVRTLLRRAAELHKLKSELKRLSEPAQAAVFASVLTRDAKMVAVCQLAARVASSSASVLLTGDTGTGKELLAQAIHQVSSRAAYPFVAVSCSALPESLIEAELFGHERGAFTGATQARRGRFEAAENGTLFLDEIGELSSAMQVKLLRVLQEGTFERLGSNQARRTDARVLCATNRDLKAMVSQGLFRADLYYRLNTISIRVPPLRERPADIGMLAEVFAQSYAKREQRPVRRVGNRAMAVLTSHAWPGNVRELQHVIHRAVLVCDSAEIGPDHLPPELCGWRDEAEYESFEFEVRNFKRGLIQRVLEKHGNNKVASARALKISRASLHRLISELQIQLPGQERHQREDSISSMDEDMVATSTL
ncbi:MAG: sigma-54 interaction domain-containing protein [Candidatus Korobacteraceae bacterium]